MTGDEVPMKRAGPERGETCLLEVAAADCEAFALCLALGTLEAIRCGAWPAEAGTWTISRPVFRDRLAAVGAPDEVLAIFSRADELSALEQLAGPGAVEE